MARTGLTAVELKEKAIQTALTQMRLYGYEKVRLSDVAKAMGISHAALYPHFKDKSELLDAVIEQWLMQVELCGASIVRSDNAPRRRLLKWSVDLYQMKRKRALDDPAPFHAFDLASSLHKPFVASHVEKMTQQLKEIIEDLGPLSQGTPSENARLFYLATVAFHHPTLVAQTANHDREVELINIVCLLCHALVSRPPVEEIK